MSDPVFSQPSQPAAGHFSTVPGIDVPRSSFDRSHGHKTALDGGLLVPIFVDEVMPASTYRMDSTVFGRLATPLKPIMDNIKADIHYWFVPNRLVWDNFKKFMGEKTNPGDSTTYTVPKVAVPLNSPVDSLPCYMGIPHRNLSATVNVNALPFRAYNLIYNEWYRDENLIDSVVVNRGDGPDVLANYTVRRRGKRADYFTTCLPWPQKGSAVMVPLGSSATVRTAGAALVTGSQPYAVWWRKNDGLNFPVAQNANIGYSAAAGSYDGVTVIETTGQSGTTQLYPSNLYADLSTATAATINDWRQAFQIQRMLERNARGGTRYIEILLAHWGVTSSDRSQQRPQFLNGGYADVRFSQVPNTTSTQQGNLGAYASVVCNAGFEASFEEHGYIIGILSFRADLTYQQGIERHWWRDTIYDFPWPALAHTGEQAVLNREIFVQGNASDTGVFGYQERFAECRYKPSRVSGILQSDYSAPLDSWHLGLDFASLPLLNQSFIEDNPPIDRVIAVPSEPHFIVDCWFKLTCEIPLPVYGQPGLIDHM